MASLFEEKIVLVLSTFILLGIFATGISQVVARPLNSDEVYTKNYVHKFALINCILGDPLDDANHFPLSHMVEKGYEVILDSLGFHWSYVQPAYYENTLWQILLRIPSVLFISIAVAFSFYFYSRNFSPAIGFLNFVASISSAPLWIHMAEARYYALWYLLTTLHIAFVLLIANKKPKREDSLWDILIVIQFLLSLCVVFSILNIIATVVVFACFRLISKKFLACTTTQLGFWFYYYSVSPKRLWFFAPHGPPLKLFLAHFPYERLFVVFLFLFFIVFSYGNIRRKLEEQLPLFFFCLISFLLTILEMIKLHTLRTEVAGAGSEVANRYFFNLTALSVVAMSCFSFIIIKSVYNKPWLRFIIILILTMPFICRLERTMSLYLFFWLL